MWREKMHIEEEWGRIRGREFRMCALDYLFGSTGVPAALLVFVETTTEPRSCSDHAVLSQSDRSISTRRKKLGKCSQLISESVLQEHDSVPFLFLRCEQRCDRR